MLWSATSRRFKMKTELFSIRKELQISNLQCQSPLSNSWQSMQSNTVPAAVKGLKHLAPAAPSLLCQGLMSHHSATTTRRGHSVLGLMVKCIWPLSSFCQCVCCEINSFPKPLHYFFMQQVPFTLDDKTLFTFPLYFSHMFLNWTFWKISFGLL